MKNIFLVCFLIFASHIHCQVSYPGQDFDKGFKAGYEKGFCAEKYGCSVNEYSIQVPSPNAGYDSYDDGYTRGVAAGTKAKNGNSSSSSSSSGSSSRRQIAKGISTQDAMAYGAASSSGNQPVDIGNAFMEGYNKSKAAADAARKEKLANMSPSKTETIIPLKVNLKNYSHIAIVGADYKSLYGSIQKELIDSPLTAINPKEFDKKKFRKDRRFLKSIKNPKWVYLYYKKVIQGYDEIRTVIVRDFQNNIIYHTKTTNISFNENLSPLVNF